MVGSAAWSAAALDLDVQSVQASAAFDCSVVEAPLCCDVAATDFVGESSAVVTGAAGDATIVLGINGVSAFAATDSKDATNSVNTTPPMTCFRGAKVCTKMATGKSDDELIQLDNKMRIWTRSGKFRKVENPELSMAWCHCMTRTPMATSMIAWHCMTRTSMTTSMIAWHCTMRTPLTTSTDTHMSVSAHSLVLSCLYIICTRTASQVLSHSLHPHVHGHLSVSPRLDSPFLISCTSSRPLSSSSSS